MTQPSAKTLSRATFFGFPRDEWSLILERARAVLIAVARQGGTIAYQDLKVAIGRNRPAWFRAIPYVLGEIVDQDIAANRPLLAAVAVGQDMAPGSGLVEKARAVGIQVTDPDAYWATEWRRVVLYYRKLK